MSRSLVTVVEPQRRPAKPPMITKRTPWSTSVVRARTGSKLEGLTGSAGPHGSDAIEIPCLFCCELRSALRRELEKIAHGGAVDSDASLRDDFELEAAGVEESFESIEARRRTAVFDAGYRRLGDAGPPPELALTQIGFRSSVWQKRRGRHVGKYIGLIFINISL